MLYPTIHLDWPPALVPGARIAFASYPEIPLGTFRFWGSHYFQAIIFNYIFEKRHRQNLNGYVIVLPMTGTRINSVGIRMKFPGSDTFTPGSGTINPILSHWDRLSCPDLTSQTYHIICCTFLHCVYLGTYFIWSWIHLSLGLFGSVFHSAGSVNPIGKVNNCRELRSESAHPNRPFVMA